MRFNPIHRRTILKTTEQHIKDSIEYHRRWWRLSQRALSSAFGWSPNTINRMESGEAQITLPQLLVLAEFFNESLAEFVDIKWSEALKYKNEQATQ